MTTFDTTVGMSYLRALHINDSKTALSSHKDRHENIGLYVLYPFFLRPILCPYAYLYNANTNPPPIHRGHLTLSAFAHLLSDPRLKNIPLILETPTFQCPPVWAKEIEVLNRLSFALAVSGGTELGDELGDEMLQGTVQEVKDAVKDAEASGKGKKGKKGIGGAARGKKRKADDEEEDYEG